MKRVLQGLLFISILAFSIQISAQKKYAIVIGINKYYSKPGVLHGNQLRGCENDANAIKGMLINRFGFKKEDIILLVNENATRKNLEQSIDKTLKKAKKGDAFFFYFSGHGVWMENLGQNEREKVLKQGMNQAIVLSDLYADNLGCLFRDSDVKRMFNKFIDKKVIATGIFDCCYAGHMTQSTLASFHNPYIYLKPEFDQKSMDLMDVLNNFQENNDSLRKIPYPNWDAYFRNNVSDTESNTKSFRLKDKLTINDNRFIVRPSERPHSQFLSLSATDEYQKGEEVKDAHGQYHGVFTKAILQIYQRSSSDIPVSELFDKVKALIKKQGFSQTPLRFQDRDRLSKNLIGMDTKGLNNDLEVQVQKITENSIVLDKGSAAGLARGNVLSLNGNKNSLQIQIISSTSHTSQARLIQGNYSQLKVKNRFIQTDTSTKFEPLLKVYVELYPVSTTDFEKYVNEKIVPLSKLSNYRDYSNWYGDEQNQYLFLNTTGILQNTFSDSFLSGVNQSPFLAFLPLPEDALTSFKTKLQSDPNYELVSDPAKANFVLYLNYTKESFVFTWAPYLTSKNNALAFYSNHLKIKQLPKEKTGIALLTEDLMNMTNQLAHDFTGLWLSENPANK